MLFQCPLGPETPKSDARRMLRAANLRCPRPAGPSPSNSDTLGKGGSDMRRTSATRLVCALCVFGDVRPAMAEVITVGPDEPWCDAINGAWIGMNTRVWK